jgi:hypothetical protein
VDKLIDASVKEIQLLCEIARGKVSSEIIKGRSTGIIDKDKVCSDVKTTDKQKDALQSIRSHTRSQIAKAFIDFCALNVEENPKTGLVAFDILLKVNLNLFIQICWEISTYSFVSVY